MYEEHRQQVRPTPLFPTRIYGVWPISPLAAMNNQFSQSGVVQARRHVRPMHAQPARTLAKMQSLQPPKLTFESQQVHNGSQKSNESQNGQYPSICGVVISGRLLAEQLKFTPAHREGRRPIVRARACVCVV